MSIDSSKHRTNPRVLQTGVSILVAVAAASASLPAAAQTTPYRSSQRSSIGGGLGQHELPRGGVFEPRLEAAAQYANNMTLEPDGKPQVDTFGLEFAPGLYASYSSDNALAAIDYSLIGRIWDDSDYNDVSHRLSANGQWNAIPGWFGLRGQASYSDAVIDPRDGLNYGGIGIFGPSNMSEVAAAAISPVLEHAFRHAVLSASYSYGRTWYLDQGKGQPTAGFVYNQDSEDQNASISIASVESSARLSGRVYYNWQESQYDNALPYRYESTGIDGGLQVSNTLTLVGDVGLESDLDASTTQGGLDSEFWSAGLRWSPNSRSSAEVRYGERFFGDTWLVRIKYRARLLEFNAGYSEQPTVETRTLSLGEFDPGTLPPDDPSVDFGRFNSTPYVATRMNAGVRAEGSRTSLSLNVYRTDRDYLRITREDETNSGAAFSATRRLASNLSADFTLSYDEYERGIDPAIPGATTRTDSQDVTAVFRLNREAGRKLTISGEAGYLTRTSDVDYDGWWLGVRARWLP